MKFAYSRLFQPSTAESPPKGSITPRRRENTLPSYCHISSFLFIFIYRLGLRRMS